MRINVVHMTILPHWQWSRRWHTSRSRKRNEEMMALIWLKRPNFSRFHHVSLSPADADVMRRIAQRERRSRHGRLRWRGIGTSKQTALYWPKVDTRHNPWTGLEGEDSESIRPTAADGVGFQVQETGSFRIHQALLQWLSQWHEGRGGVFVGGPGWTAQEEWSKIKEPADETRQSEQIWRLWSVKMMGSINLSS